MIDYLGWLATAVFVGSYFCGPGYLRRMQMAGAMMWVLYGVLIGAAPVVAANGLVIAAAGWTARKQQRLVPESRPARGLTEK